MIKREMSAPIVTGKIFRPMKKDSEGVNKVFVPNKAIIQMMMTTQNKLGKRAEERSILASLLSATSSAFLRISV